MWCISCTAVVSRTKSRYLAANSLSVTRHYRYGSIGMACAKLAKAYGMRIIALRRNPEQSRSDPNVDQVRILQFLYNVWLLI